MKRIALGRHVYGLASIGFGVIAFVWHQFNTWEQIRPLGNLSHPEVLLYIVAAVQLIGGFAIQWSKTTRPAAAALGCVYLAFALLWVPLIAKQPLVYDGWGNLFEQLSIVAGALIVYGSLEPRESAGSVGWVRIGYIQFGICCISFTLEQLFNLHATAGAVPKWIFPGQMFWAIATTVALGMAALAILTRQGALLASRLLTLMILGFGLLVWLPAVLADQHQLFNWAANAQNLAILGSAWVVADYLSRKRSAAAAS